MVTNCTRARKASSIFQVVMVDVFLYVIVNLVTFVSSLQGNCKVDITYLNIQHLSI